MHMQSYINRCCQVSPNMLSKHQQLISEGVTLILACLDFHCTVRVPSLMHLKVTSTVVVGCLQICCQSTKNPEGVSCQSTNTLRESPNVLSKYQHYWGSHTNRCCQVSPNMLSKHQQFWGSLLMYCQSTKNTEGVTLILACLDIHCTVRVLSLMHLKVTSTVVARCLQICCQSTKNPEGVS